MQAHKYRPSFHRILIVWPCALAALAVLPAGSFGQTTPRPDTTSTARPVINWGEVAANDVYVRSGDSTNHYTICKLSAGDRVAIVGQRGDWHEILPPEGAFSLISGDYVDTTDDKTGVVNGDNVRVRAGSALNDSKYTVQTMLSRGARVTILGRNPDGFLRIVPPAGATLWINKELVAPLGGSKAAQSTEGEAGKTSEQPGTTPEATPTPGVLGSPSEPVRTGAAQPAARSTIDWRAQLDEIDTLAKAEVAKPPSERSFDELIERYRDISEQNEDGYARQYALTRLDQIDNMTVLASAIQKVQRLGDAADAKRREYLAARATIPDVVPSTPSGLEIQGELRISALYPPGSTVRRYRLIDPTASFDRTIGYVELPPDSQIQIDSFIGRFVGVRASERRLQAGGVDPIPVYVARELVLLDPPKRNTVSTDKD